MSPPTLPHEVPVSARLVIVPVAVAVSLVEVIRVAVSLVAVFRAIHGPAPQIAAGMLPTSVEMYLPGHKLQIRAWALILTQLEIGNQQVILAATLLLSNGYVIPAGFFFHKSTGKRVLYD